MSLDLTNNVGEQNEMPEIINQRRLISTPLFKSAAAFLIILSGFVSTSKDTTDNNMPKGKDLDPNNISRYQSRSEVIDSTNKLKMEEVKSLKDDFTQAENNVDLEDLRYRIIVVDKIDGELASKHKLLENISDKVVDHIIELSKTQETKNYTIKNPLSDPFRYTTIVSSDYFKLTKEEQIFRAKHEVLHFYVDQGCQKIKNQTGKQCTLAEQEQKVVELQK